MKRIVLCSLFASLTLAAGSAYAGKSCGNTPDGGTATTSEDGKTTTWKCVDGKLTVLYVAPVPAPDYSKRPRR
jgi:hypothetical protein